MLGGLSGRYILVDGQPQRCDDLEIWARWMDDFQRRVVARTYLSRDGADVLPYKDILRLPRQAYAVVSTVFLSIDHGWPWQTPDAAPILYETMVAVRDKGARGGLTFLPPQWRYTSTTAATAMHKHVVAQAREWLRAGSPLTDKDSDEWPEEEEEDTQP